MSEIGLGKAVSQAINGEGTDGKRMNRVVAELKIDNGQKSKHSEQNATVSTSTVTDTVTISVEGFKLSETGTSTANSSGNKVMVLSEVDTNGPHIVIDNFELSQQKLEGRLWTLRRKYLGDEDISSSLKRPVEQNDQGKEIYASAVKQDSANSIDNVNKISRSGALFSSFLDFLNLNDKNSILQRRAESVNILA